MKESETKKMINEKLWKFTCFKCDGAKRDRHIFMLDFPGQSVDNRGLDS